MPRTSNRNNDNGKKGQSDISMRNGRELKKEKKKKPTNTVDLIRDLSDQRNVRSFAETA